MAISLTDVANTLRSWQGSLQRGVQNVAGAAEQAAAKAVALYHQHERDAEYARRQAAAMASAVRANFAKAQTTPQRMNVLDSPEYQSLPFTEKLKLVPDALQTYGGFLQGVADVASAGLTQTAAQQRQTGHPLLARVADATRGVVTTPTRLVGESLTSAGRGEVVNTAANAGFAIASATPAGAALNAAVAQPEVEQKAQKFFTRWDARGQPLYDFKQPDSSFATREASDAVRLGWNLLPFLVTHKVYRGVKELPAREAGRTFAEHTKYETPPGMNASAEAAHLQNTGRGYATAALEYLKSKTPEGTKLPWTLRGALREPTAFADEFAKQMGKRRFDTLYANPLAPLRETKEAIFGERNLPTGAPLAALASLQTAPQFSLRDDALRGKITSQKALPTTPSATDLTQQPPKFTGLDGLSTRVVEDLQGKTSVSKQHIENLARQSHIKAAERELVAQTLAKLPGEQVPVAEFARQMQAATLPLKNTADRWRYENINLPNNLRGKVARYQEVIYQSPVATRAGKIHFYETGPNSTAFPNYFAHTRREDLAGNTRRLLEIQSDLFQHGRFQKERNSLFTREANRQQENFNLNNQHIYVDGIRYFVSERTTDGSMYRLTNPKTGYDELAAFSWIAERDTRIKNLIQINPATQSGFHQLQAYRQDWWKRIVREEIYKAAQDGKSELLFPTGETAMQIEGLNQEVSWEILLPGQSVLEPGRRGGRADLARLTPTNIAVGQRISRENFVPDETEWIVSEVLADGRFKAVPRDIIERALALQNVKNPEIALQLIAGKHLAGMSRYEETFDISGRVDTENPIYQFYEKDIQKFLKQIRPDLERITDERGVTWFRTRLQPQTETVKGDLAPVLAFKTGGKRDLQSGDLNEQAQFAAEQKLRDRFGQIGSRGSVEWLLGNGKIPPLAGTPPTWKSHQKYREWQQDLKKWHGSEREKQAAFTARQEAARDPDMLTTGQKEALLTQMNFTGDKWRTDPKSGQKIPKGRFQPKVNVPDVMQLERSGKAVLDVLRVPEEGERAPVTFRLDGNKELSFRPFILPLIRQAAGSGKEIYIDVNSGGASVVKVLPELASAGLREAHLNFFDKEKHLVEQALYEGKLEEVLQKVRAIDGDFRRNLLQQLARHRVNNASPEVNAFAQKYLAAYPDGSFDERFIEWIEKTKLDGEQIPIPLQGSEYYEAWRQTILNVFGEITPKEVRTLDDAIYQAYRDRIATRGNQGFIGVAGMKSKEQSVENFIAALKADAAAYSQARAAGLTVTIYSEDGKQFVRARMLDLNQRGLVNKAVLYTDPPYIQTTRTYLPQVRDHAGRVALAEYTTPDGLEKIYEPALREIPNGLDFIATNDVAAPYLERFLTHPFNHRIYAYKEHTTPTSLIHTLRTPEELRQFRATERFKSVRGYVPAQRSDPQLNPGGGGFGGGEPAWSDFLDDVKQKRELPEDVRRAFVEERLRDIPKPKVGAGVSTLDPLRAAEAQDGQRFGVLKDRVRSLEEAHHEQHVEEMRFDAEHRQLQAETGVKQGTAESAIAFQIAEGTADPHSHPGALRYAKWARKKYDEWLDRMNVERIAIGRDPIVKRQQYMTHYQDLAEIAEILRAFGIEMNNVPAQMLAISEFTKPNSRFFQFAKRREGTRHTPDAVGAVLSYKSKAFEQIHMTRPLKLFRDILEYRVRAPTAYEGHRTVTASYFATKYPHAYEYWTDYLNSLAGKRDKFDKYFPNIAGGAGFVRRLFARGSIGGNIHTVLIQPAAVANAIRETGAYAFVGYSSLLDPTGRWAKYALTHSRVLLTRRFEVDAKFERLFGSMKAAQAYDAVGRVLTAPVQAMDVVTATGAWLAGFFHARHSLKLSADEAYRYADDVVVRTQSSGNAIHRPPINRGEIKTTFGQFQTWVYNEYRSVFHDTFGKAFFGKRVERPSIEGEGLRGIQDTRSKGWSRVFWLVIGSYLVNELYNQLLGEDVTFSPIHIGKALLTGDRERAVGNITTAIPFASTVRFGGSPALKFFSGVARMAVGDENQRTDGWRDVKSSLLRLLPAGGQVSKTVGALPSVDSGKLKIGNETIPLDGTAEKIRALLLGKYGTKAAQSYFTARDLGIPYDLYLEAEKLREAGASAKANALIQTYRTGKDYKNTRRDATSELRSALEKAVKAGDRPTFEKALAAYLVVDPVGANEYIRQLQKPKPDFGLTPATDETALGSLGVRERVDFYLQQKDENGFREYLQSLPPRSRAEVQKYLVLKAALASRQIMSR